MIPTAVERLGFAVDRRFRYTTCSFRRYPTADSYTPSSGLGGIRWLRLDILPGSVSPSRATLGSLAMDRNHLPDNARPRGLGFCGVLRCEVAQAYSGSEQEVGRMANEARPLPPAIFRDGRIEVSRLGCTIVEPAILGHSPVTIEVGKLYRRDRLSNEVSIRYESRPGGIPLRANPIDRRDFLRVAGGGAAGTAVSCTATDRVDQRPNILFLFSDDQRADVAGYAGNSAIQTPALD